MTGRSLRDLAMDLTDGTLAPDTVRDAASE
jgi:hypothetical protein